MTPDEKITKPSGSHTASRPLFSLVPERFFSVLSSPLKRLYADALYILYGLYSDQPLGVPRETLVLAFTDLADEWMRASGSTEDDDPDLAGLDLSSPRARAAAMVHKLEKTGWISVDRRPDYSFFVLIPDYASRILEALVEVSQGRDTEYQSYAYGVYTQLFARQSGGDVWQALDVAKDLTDRLVRELLRLRDNIGRYVDQVVKHKRPQDLLAAHFLEYQQDISDRSYHRLKTSDNVSKYRQRILSRLNEWLDDKRWLTSLTRELVQAKRFGDNESAREEVVRRLAYLRNAYEGVDAIIEEVDRRHERYVRTSVERVRYMISSSRDMEGRIRDLLALLASELSSGSGGDAEGFSLDLDNFRLFQPASLYTPRSALRNHNPTPLADGPGQTAAMEAYRRVRKRVADQITVRRVNSYLGEKMGERPEIRAIDLGVETTRDFVYLICTGAFSHRWGAEYSVDYEGEAVSSAAGKYKFKNVLIKRK